MANHDPSYKLLFSHCELVADLTRGFVHEEMFQRVSEIGISHELRKRGRHDLADASG